MVLHRDAGMDPAGDVTTADIAREIANDVGAAGFAVVAATIGHWEVVGKSVAQLVVNLVSITVAGALVLTIRRRHANTPRNGAASSRSA